MALNRSIGGRRHPRHRRSRPGVLFSGPSAPYCLSAMPIPPKAALPGKYNQFFRIKSVFSKILRIMGMTGQRKR